MAHSSDPSPRALRRVRLREELRPLPISTGVPPRPIDAQWALILRAQHADRATFHLAFYAADGRLRQWLRYDTLETALAQAAAIVGIEPSEWDTCDLALDDDGSAEWCRTMPPRGSPNLGRHLRSFWRWLWSLIQRSARPAHHRRPGGGGGRPPGRRPTPHP